MSYGSRIIHSQILSRLGYGAEDFTTCLWWRRLGSRPIPSATCTLQTRKQVPRGAFFFMCQRGLQGPSALRRLASRARSVSECPPSLSTRPALSARRVQNIHAFQETGGIALRPCFAGSGLSQSRWRGDTGGVVVGMPWESCAKSLMTNAVSPSTVPFCRLVLISTQK